MIIFWEFAASRQNFDFINEPSFLSVVPPLIAIVMALLTKEIILSLFCGIWVGSTILWGFHPVTGFTKSLDTYLVSSLADPAHASILLFSLGFGGVIGVISANGGMQGIVQALTNYAQSRRTSQLSTMLMGIVIFFDDYTNTLFVGNMMRPFTDKLKISREKLSYIVDSTAAPVASIAVISTWSVFQMSLLENPYNQYGITEGPYITFIKSIPFSFYCWAAIFFMVYLIWTKRDYGPMHNAEKRAFTEGKVMRDGAQPLSDINLKDDNSLDRKPAHWIFAILPIATIIMITMIGLYITGKHGTSVPNPGLMEIIGASNSYASLMWGSFTGGLLAIIISVVYGILPLKESVNSWLNGVKSMMIAFVVLILAWTIGKICQDIKTADYLISVTQSFLTVEMLPAVTFVTAAIVSFSTGTSWGTMSVLGPIIIPMAFQLGGPDPNAFSQSPVFLATFSAILSGAVFGDHCSPISDTTILSSMASGSDHIDHVKTQLPYALTVGFFSLVLGYLLTGYGVSWIVVILLMMIAIMGVIRIKGKLIET